MRPAPYLIGRYLAVIGSISCTNGAACAPSRRIAASGVPSGHAQPPRRARPARTCSSTRTTRSTGIPWGGTRSRARSYWTARSSCRSATRPATGATSWSASRSRTRRRPGCSTSASWRSRWTARSGRTSTRSTWRAVQAMTGSGGWPMSVFLTPDGAPFYGGTYFPDRPRHGMPSFRQVLEGVSKAWTTQRGEVARRGPAARVARSSSRARDARRPAASPAIDRGLFEAVDDALDAVVRRAQRVVGRRAQVPAADDARVPAPPDRRGRSSAPAAMVRVHARQDGRRRDPRPARRRLPPLRDRRRAGSCRTSSRCSTTTPSSRACTCTPGRVARRASSAIARSRPACSTTCSAS